MLAFASLLRPRTDLAAGAHSRSGRVGPGCPGLRWPGGGRRGNAGALPRSLNRQTLQPNLKILEIIIMLNMYILVLFLLLTIQHISSL